MIDKELKAMAECHEVLGELDTDAKWRVFKYLLDRYNLIPNIHSTALSKEIPAQDLGTIEIPVVTKVKQNSSKLPKKALASKSYSMIPDLNLMPVGQESLQDFYNTYISKNNYTNTLIIMYYLQNILKIQNITVNHIYTCYKDLSIPVPSIHQNIRDIKSKRNWINLDYENLKLSVAGDNFMEHKIDKIK